MLGEKCRIPGSSVARRWGGAPEIDLSGVGGSLFVTALNKSLGEGCRVTQSDDALVIRFDVEEWPRSMAEGKQALRIFTSEAAPDATADQHATTACGSPRNWTCRSR